MGRAWRTTGDFDRKSPLATLSEELVRRYFASLEAVPCEAVWVVSSTWPSPKHNWASCCFRHPGGCEAQKIAQDKNVLEHRRGFRCAEQIEAECTGWCLTVLSTAP